MITCPICHTSNHHLQVICTSCGGFVQQRIDTLDLFKTIGKAIESPGKAFHSIAIAEHKNYSLVLGAFSGYALTSFIFWYIHAGDIARLFIEVLVAGAILGPFVGIVVFFLHIIFSRFVIRAFGYSTKFRNLMSVIAYTLFPLIISSFFILPVELITFGIFLFTKSPNPFSLLPASAMILFGINALFVLWFLILHIKSVEALLDISLVKSIAITLLSVFFTVVSCAVLLSFIPTH